MDLPIIFAGAGVLSAICYMIGRSNILLLRSLGALFYHLSIYGTLLFCLWLLAYIDMPYQYLAMDLISLITFPVTLVVIYCMSFSLPARETEEEKPKIDTEDFEKASDIRDMAGKKHWHFKFDILTYARRGYMTLGIEPETYRPVRVKLKDYYNTHVQLLGSAGTGKTVAASQILSQDVWYGRPVIVADPKGDKHLPHRLYQLCQKRGVEYHYVDLNSDQPAQLNPFIGATSGEMEELMYCTFNLQATGAESDYHKMQNREAARRTAEIMSSMEIPSIAGVLPLVRHMTQAGFVGAMTELSKLQSINAEDIGVNFEEVLNGRGVIYLAGSTTNPQVRIAMALCVAKITQMIKRRDRSKKYPVASIFFDEFKYVCDARVLSILSTLRDRGLHALIANQSQMDFKDVPGINADAVYGAAVDNTQIKQIYRIEDPATCKVIAERTGYKRVYTSSTDGERPVVKESTSYLIDPNTLITLPRRMAVTLRPGEMAVVTLTSPQKARFNKKALRVIPQNPAAPVVLPKKVVIEKDRSKKVEVKKYEYDI